MDKMQVIEQTLESREVAEMVEKAHSELLKDIQNNLTKGKFPTLISFKKVHT